MDRLEYVRVRVDRILQKIEDEESRKYAYIHLYGVSQFASMLAKQQGLNMELCAIAGMLHDISTYIEGYSSKHALVSSEYSKNLLEKTQIFHADEIDVITQAIAHHSDKEQIDGPYEELLKNADVLQHYFYNPSQFPKKEQTRLDNLLEKLSLSM